MKIDNKELFKVMNYIQYVDLVNGLNDNQVYLMLNPITMEQYFLISGTLIMLLSAGIYVFGEKFEDIDVLQKYIFSRAKEVLDFDAKVKVLV